MIKEKIAEINKQIVNKQIENYIKRFSKFKILNSDDSLFWHQREMKDLRELVFSFLKFLEEEFEKKIIDLKYYNNLKQKLSKIYKNLEYINSSIHRDFSVASNSILEISTEINNLISANGYLNNNNYEILLEKLVNLGLDKEKFSDKQLGFFVSKYNDFFLIKKSISKFEFEELMREGWIIISSFIEKKPNYWKDFVSLIINCNIKVIFKKKNIKLKKSTEHTLVKTVERTSNVLYLLNSIVKMQDFILKYPECWIDLVNLGFSKKEYASSYYVGLRKFFDEFEYDLKLWKELIFLAKEGYGKHIVNELIEMKSFLHEDKQRLYDIFEILKNLDRKNKRDFLFSLVSITEFFKNNPSYWLDFINFIKIKQDSKLAFFIVNCLEKFSYSVEKCPNLWPKILEEFLSFQRISTNFMDFFTKKSQDIICILIDEYENLYPEIYYDFFKFANTSEESKYVIEEGISQLIPLIKNNPNLWPNIGYELIHICSKHNKKNLSFFLSSGLNIIISLMEKNENLWPQIGYDFIRYIKEDAKEATHLMKYGILPIIDIISKNTYMWPRIGNNIFNLLLNSKPENEFFPDLRNFDELKNVMFKIGIFISANYSYWDGIYKLGLKFKKNFIGSYFELVKLFPIIKKDINFWNDLVDIGTKLNNPELIFSGPVISIMKDPNLWPQIGYDFIEIENKSKNTRLIFKGILIMIYLVENKICSFKDIKQFLLLIESKYHNDFRRIMLIVEEIVPEIKNSKDLGLLWAYLKEFSILDKDIFIQFKNMTFEEQKNCLKHHKEKYESIILGNDIEYSEENIKYIYHAISSSNLSINQLKETLSRYGEEASKLEKSEFKSFSYEIKSVKDVKLSGKIDEKLFNYYKDMFKLFNEIKEVEDIDLNKFLNEHFKNNKEILGAEYSEEIAWRFILYKTIKLLGEDTRSKLFSITKNDYNYFINNLFELRDLYDTFQELYNDTVKDNLLELNKELQEKFMEFHRPLSRIDKLFKENKKFIEVKGKDSKKIVCIPSKKSLDLFYGYYGENCTSEAPAELLNPLFTPVRMIVYNTIQGCLHFYKIDYNGKKILGILGIEPKSWLVNNVNNEKLFEETIKAIIKEAKRTGYDMVGLPICEAMHSNRGKIGQLIAEKIRDPNIPEKDRLPINIEFPKNHRGYKTGEIRIIWKKGFF